MVPLKIKEFNLKLYVFKCGIALSCLLCPLLGKMCSVIITVVKPEHKFTIVSTNTGPSVGIRGGSTYFEWGAGGHRLTDVQCDQCDQCDQYDLMCCSNVSNLQS